MFLAILIAALPGPIFPSAQAIPLSPTSGSTIYLPMIFTGLQPPVLKWQRGGCYASWCETGWYSSPAVANIDGDPQMEVLAGTYDLAALDGETGALEWRAENSSRVWPGIGAGDMEGDGDLEIVAGRGGDLLTVYNSAGGIDWQRSPFGAGEIRTLALADLEDDGLVEIIVGRASGGATKQLSVYRAGWLGAGGLAGAAGRRPGLRLGDVQPERGGGRPGWGRLQGDYRSDGHTLHHGTGPEWEPAPGERDVQRLNPVGPKVWARWGCTWTTR